ncbi:MAG: DUF6624 domain-containing protein [Planctomycetota bacterium]
MRTTTIVLLLAALAAAGYQSPDTAEPNHDTPQQLASAELTHPELRAALLDLRERDQAARGAMVELMRATPPEPSGGFRFADEDLPIIEAVGEIDVESTAFLKQTIADHGWPTFDMVGEDGAGAAWILAQHADADPEFQAQVLALMEPLVEAGQAHADDFALLTDRVLRARGEPQVYGTQFAWDVNGVQRPGPTIDWGTVDERRAKVGLPTIAEYVEIMRATYGGEVSAEPMSIDSD